MHVLAVFCDPRRDSFSGAVLDRFVEGGYGEDLDNLWRRGVLGYGGVDPIRIELLLDAAFDTGNGVHERYLETAYRAGQEIGQA